MLEIQQTQLKYLMKKEVDELMVFDIDASSENNNREPNFKMIKNLADECRMPFLLGRQYFARNYKY